MRTDPVRFVSTVVLLSAAVVMGRPALAQPAAVRIELAPERMLRAGAHATIEVVVHMPAGNDSPLMLTPSAEGEALEVVRGRLTRPDAKPVDGDAMRLRFEVPVRARSEGTAILRVDVMTYICERRCERVLLRASEVVRVRADIARDSMSN